MLLCGVVVSSLCPFLYFCIFISEAATLGLRATLGGGGPVPRALGYPRLERTIVTKKINIGSNIIHHGFLVHYQVRWGGLPQIDVAYLAYTFPIC